jgi:hypothetical protein
MPALTLEELTAAAREFLDTTVRAPRSGRLRHHSSIWAAHSGRTDAEAAQIGLQVSRLALLNALVAEDLPGPGSVFLHVDWNFRAPVRPGDEITAEAEVLSVRDDKPICSLRATITNQDGTVVLDGTALVFQDPLDGG